MWVGAVAGMGLDRAGGGVTPSQGKARSLAMPSNRKADSCYIMIVRFDSNCPLTRHLVVRPPHTAGHKPSPDTQASGSAYVELEHTKVLCAVYGPKPRQVRIVLMGGLDVYSCGVRGWGKMCQASSFERTCLGLGLCCRPFSLQLSHAPNGTGRGVQRAGEAPLRLPVRALFCVVCVLYALRPMPNSCWRPMCPHAHHAPRPNRLPEPTT